MQTRRTTWTIGGLGLIVCGLLAIFEYTISRGPGAALFTFPGELPFAAMVLLFAIGLSREASVVNRKPLGMAALIVVAVWPIIASMLLPILIQEQTSPGDGPTVFTYIDLIVRVAAGVIAVIQIARAGIVPSPWRWAPLWAFAAHAAVWVVLQILLVGAGTADPQGLVSLILTLSLVANLVGTLGLGVIALVLALQSGAETVEVNRSPAPAVHPDATLHNDAR
ncbi:hypothetical protein [Microbacterium sp. zg-YB36]|uniref:hypothetical protein n=1 Tax=Microbacterium sp. zg-YB36 TaxID=2969407 RepID=UPI00214BCFD5|nr:hypothetical protein [Microbacterium sp. zg-YB36]MDL5350590.1 hypothetical protein [Microbacterium sp. zg-YB36]